MTVDLMTLKKGDTVHFRCGGKAEVTGKPYLGSATYWPLTVQLDGIGGFAYEVDGTKNKEKNHLLDIVGVTPAAFDWGTIKWGMAFKYAGGYSGTPKSGIYYYLAPSLPNDGCGMFAYKGRIDTAKSWSSARVK